MKLLFDENISERLAEVVRDVYPGSLHVRDVGLDAKPDEAIWVFAASNGFVIVSKDTDFQARSIRTGPPPKVIALVVGNCTTAAIASLLRRHLADIESFGRSTDALMTLG